MIEEFRRGHLNMMKLQLIVRQILSGDESVSESCVCYVRDYVKKHGLCGIFKFPEEAYPSVGKILDGLGKAPSRSAYVDDDGCDDWVTEANLTLKHRSFLLMQMALSGDNLLFADKYDIRERLLSMLLGVRDVNDLSRVVDKCMHIEPFYANDEDLAIVLWPFIGDLCYAMGKYDEAIEWYCRFNDAKNNDPHHSWGDVKVIVPLLNACCKANVLPPIHLLVKGVFGGLAQLEPFSNKMNYLERRLLVECDRHANIFEWALTGQVIGIDNKFGVFDSLGLHDARNMRCWLHIKPFVCFPRMSPFVEFRKMVCDEIRLMSKTEPEFADEDFVEQRWLEKLDWFEAVHEFLPDEEVVFGFHTPWTWKFAFDLFFPKRKLAIVFHLPEKFDEGCFKGGHVGKVQYIKEWGRVVAKAKKKYGMKIAYVPVTQDKSDFVQLLSLCECGSLAV